MNDYRVNTTKTWAQTMEDLEDTFRRWGVRDWSVDCRLAGRAGAARKSADRTERRVLLRWRRPEGTEVLLTYDRLPRAVDNLRALYLVAERMRLIAKAGLEDVARDAYAQLPPPRQEQAPAEDPYAVLGVRQDAPMSVVEAAYRNLAHQAHPDRGGSGEAMQRLNWAVETIRTQRSAHAV